MRKRATDGTKISTSPTMTKKMVRISRRADRLLRNILTVPLNRTRRESERAGGCARRTGSAYKRLQRLVCRPPEQRISDHDPSVIKRDVGELRPPGDIADGKDTAVRGAQTAVDGDPGRRRRDPRSGEVKRVDIRPSPGRDQEMRAGEPLPFG